MRAVLDPNVVISGLLSPHGAPGQLLAAWRDGSFELIISATLLTELKRALAYPRLRERISAAEATSFLDGLRHTAALATDDHPVLLHSVDPDDDYLLALATGEKAYLVSGDKHLLTLGQQLPILRPARFLELIST